MTSVSLDMKNYDNNYTRYQAGLLQIYQGLFSLPCHKVKGIVNELVRIDNLKPFDVGDCNSLLEEIASGIVENRNNYCPENHYEPRERARRWFQKKTKSLLGYWRELDATIKQIFNEDELPKRQQELENEYEELEFWKKHPL